MECETKQAGDDTSNGTPGKKKYIIDLYIVVNNLSLVKFTTI
jgi:hypothetical protein